MYAFIITSAIAIVAVAYFIVLPIIKYFRDPKGFRRFPNLSPLAALTDLAWMNEASKGGNRSNTLYELHKTHPVVRIGPNSLSYGTVQAIKDIYGHGTKCLKGDMYPTLAGSHFHLADVQDKAEHARKRKVLAASYALQNLEDWEYKVADKTERFIHGCDRACTTPPLSKGPMRPDPQDLTFDYRLWANLFTVDAIADIGLSEKLGLLDQGHDLVTAEMMDGTLFQVPFRACLHATATAQSHLVWGLEWYNVNATLSKWISPYYRKMWKLNEGWNGAVLHRAMKRLRRWRAGERPNDFFQALLEDKSGRAHNLELGEMVAEVSIMMNAGSDTTAIAMNNVVYHLLRNRTCLEQARAEVDAVLDADEVVAPYDKVRYLPYLRACLDESLRLTPPSSFVLPRKTPPEGAQIAGQFIAGDTTVGISAYVAHRDPTVFPDPEAFRPDRWLGEKGKELQPYFISFSAGARGCIGRNISYLEQTVLLASVIHRYDFALPHPEWEQERWEAFNLMPGPLPLKVWRRRDLAGEDLLPEKCY